MGRSLYFFCGLVLLIAALGGCAGERSAKQTTKPAIPREKIQGSAQIVLTETNQTDKALSAGGASVYLWQGMDRYRLFLRKPVELEGGKEYVVEGYDAQKIIDSIGDPDEGKNGYPLLASCRKVVTTAWPGMALDVTDGHTLALRDRVRRYPARHVFLVTQIQPAPPKEGDEAKKAAEKAAQDLPEITVAADQQKALLIEGQSVRTAPLWAPAGDTVRCKVLIDGEGKVSEVRTGAQLCEDVEWSKFRYKPTVQKGKVVQVATEVEVRFEPRKAAPAS